MFALSIVFLAAALVAGYFSFRGGGNKSWEGAKLVCFIFLVAAVVTYFASVN